MKITSFANARLKWIRKLRERKARQESGCFYAEGLRVLIEADRQGMIFESLVYSPALLTSPAGQALVAKQTRLGAEILEVPADLFQSIALKDSPTGLAGVLRQQWLSLDQVRLTAGDVWVALDEAADPGNLGTILRTADAVGAQGAILLGRCTDPYDPTAARASMGALFTQRLVRAEHHEFIDWVQRGAAIHLTGASGAAELDYQQARYPKPHVVLMGSERQGLKDELVRICDQLVSIPMVGSSDSLNLAVATGVILYEIFNQQRHEVRV